ncbi:hypothetical protein HAX54_040700 [Datura stramonium]|uniref:Uncharacterized protein n=1 Tax=Datura stramonium TaxID=4076 RepID=A0ABS8VN33_DATST|nr:hypothetical protein [Datura stramonium]
MAEVALRSGGFARPYKQAEFEIIFGEGVSKLGCVLDCAELIDAVQGFVMVRSSVLEATGFLGSSSLKHPLPQLLEEDALQEMQHESELT